MTRLRCCLTKSVMVLTAACLITTWAGWGRLVAVGQASQPPAAAPSPSSASLRAVLDQYCITCHNQKLRTAGLTLDTIDVATGSAEIWEKVIRKLRMGAMPPVGRPRPEKATVDAVVSGLETAIDRAARDNPNPGRTETFHRLNRTEYRNAIRDLIALDIDVSSLLPPDHATQGLDNVADALSVSPVLLERYMAAARKLSRLALGLPPAGPVVDTYRLSESGTIQDDLVSEDVPFGSQGRVTIQHYFPVDGEYVINVRLRRQGYDYIMGLGEAHQFDVRVDGRRIKLFTVGGESKGTPAPASYAGNIVADPEWEDYALHMDSVLEARFHSTSGRRTVTVSLVDNLAVLDDLLPPSRPGLVGDERSTSNPAVEAVSVGGPYKMDGPGDTLSRRKILICRPTNAAQEEPCAKKILATLARRAYRRPITDQDLRPLLQFYHAGWRDHGFEAGIQFALERVLVDPDFLFRVERDPPHVAPGTVYHLSDLELASRLSFFLWSSIPDDALLDVASRGDLHKPTVLHEQVQRMLADRRADALVKNFVGQWLELRNLQSAAADPSLFPQFDASLRQAFQHETELFVGSQMREDQSVLDLLRANYTFVNERLARHYGIPNIFGDHFRRVTFVDETRGGLLGQASVLMVTSYPNRTSPVLRGKWVLENLLGTPPPPPPPNVPALKDKGEDGQLQSVRERLEAHRKNPVCANCHAPMDPLGFALENFDPIGQWRTESEAGTQIDASASLPNGTQFEGPAGLRRLVLSQPEQFVETVAEKLLAYALGRAVAYSDQPVLRTITREAAPRDYRWSSMILGIVNSVPFQMRTTGSAEATGRVAARR